MTWFLRKKIEDICIYVLSCSKTFFRKKDSGKIDILWAYIYALAYQMVEKSSIL